MAILIAVTGWDAGPWAERLRARLPDRDIRIWPDAMGDPADIRYALTWKAPASALTACPNLQAVFSLGAGADHLLGQQGLPDVPIVRVVDPDLTGRMSEWITLQVLLHHRQHLRYAAQQRRHEWTPHAQAAARDVRVGILGLGVLGADAAEVLVRLGYRVAGWARTPKDLAGVECFAGEEAFDAFLARTDILVNLLPLTPQTHGLIDRGVLDKLPRDGALGGPVFINAGRGGSHVEADIAQALRDGTLIAASLDVFETEPLPADSPLWDLETAIVTPHIAADSDPDAIIDYVAAQIRAFEAGADLENRVDPARGY